MLIYDIQQKAIKLNTIFKNSGINYSKNILIQISF